jgi:hypothetical protein
MSAAEHAASASAAEKGFDPLAGPTVHFGRQESRGSGSDRNGSGSGDPDRAGGGSIRSGSTRFSSRTGRKHEYIHPHRAKLMQQDALPQSTKLSVSPVRVWLALADIRLFMEVSAELSMRGALLEQEEKMHVYHNTANFWQPKHIYGQPPPNQELIAEKLYGPAEPGKPANFICTMDELFTFEESYKRVNDTMDVKIEEVEVQLTEDDFVNSPMLKLRLSAIHLEKEVLSGNESTSAGLRLELFDARSSGHEAFQDTASAAGGESSDMQMSRSNFQDEFAAREEVSRAESRGRSGLGKKAAGGSGKADSPRGLGSSGHLNDSRNFSGTKRSGTGMGLKKGYVHLLSLAFLSLLSFLSFPLFALNDEV